MKTYYVAGLPYSDELWHYGTKGMKWGQRLYQNPDGTLTALGKVHYGSKNLGKKIIVHISDKAKAKHKWMMSDEELKKKIERAEMEKRYTDLLKQNKSQISNGRKVVGDILSEGAKTIARGAFNKLSETIQKEMFKPEETASQQLSKEFLDEWNSRKRNYSRDELEEFSKYMTALRNIEGGNKKKG